MSCLLDWYTSRVEVDRQHPRTSKAYVFIVFHFIHLAPSLLSQHILALILLFFFSYYLFCVVGVCATVHVEARGQLGETSCPLL